jgi:hypothetical protein
MAEPVRDRDIRTRLLAHLERAYSGSDHTLIVEELEVGRGDARIDVAVVDTSLDGFEIKSEVDSLSRLADQLDAYAKVFERLWVVASPPHADSLPRMLPDWVGIIEVERTHRCDRLGFALVRPANRNPNLDARSLARLLWRNEALEVLRTVGADVGKKSTSRDYMADAIADLFEPDAVLDVVRAQLLSRSDWRPDARRLSGGATLPPSTTR